MNLDLKKIMLDLSTNIFLVVDKDGVVLDGNQRVSIFFNNDDICGVHISKLFEQHVFESLKYHASKAVVSNLPVGFVMSIDGRIYDCCIYPYSFGFVFYFDDITVLRESSETINELAKRADLTQNVNKIGYFEMNLTDNSIFFSAELYRLFGMVRKKNVHSNIITERIYLKDMNKYTKKIKLLIEKNKSINVKLRFLRKDTNEIIYCYLRASIYCDDSLCKVVGTIQDLSNIIETEKKLKSAKRRAENLSKARSYFIAQASHDLRQPIQAMRMFVHSLKGDKLNKKQASILNSIDASAENLSYLLDNLMDVSKLDYGGEKYYPYLFSASDLFKKIIKEYEEIAYNKNIEFIFNVENVEIYSSSFFIERMVRNLLDNAFKYTKDKVWFDVAKKDDEQHLIISIKDNGIGIKKSDKKHVFDEFFQIKHTNSGARGLGLGLTIVKKMADLLGAKIDLKTRVNKGSTFIIELPINKKA